MAKRAAKLSAGLLMYRRTNGLELFLVHPGGPFFRNKDDGAWTVPKGEVEGAHDWVATAKREFEEETGLEVTAEDLLALGEVRQAGGKRVVAWAFEGDCDPSAIESNRFEMEWPPRSGKRQEFPEIDRACFFEPDVARKKLNPAQRVFVDRLQEKLAP